MLGCYPSQPFDALLYGKTLASDSAENYGSLDVYRLYVDHIPGSHLIRTGPCDSCPDVFHRDHSRHVAAIALLRACVENEAGPPGSWTEE